MSRRASAASLTSVGRFIAHAQVPLFRNAYALIFSTATTSGLGMLYWALAARYYTSEAVGLNAAAISAMIFVSGVSRLYLDGALIRFVPQAGRMTARLVGYSYLLSEVMTLVVGLVFILGISIWAPSLGFLGGSPYLILWFVLASMTASIFSLQDAVLTGLREAIWVPVENIIFAIVKIVLLIVFTRLSPEYGIFASWTIPVVVSLFPISILIFLRLIPRHVQATQAAGESLAPAQIAKYAAGNYLGSLFMLAYTRLLPILVVSQAGTSANAYFYLPWVIANSLQLVAINMSQSLIVEGAVDQAKLGSYGRHALMHTARLLVPVVVIVLLGAPYILRIFGKSYAAEGTQLLRLLVLAVIPNSICVLSFGLARVQGYVRRIVIFQGLLTALVLSLCYILLRSYGLIGVGIGYFVSQSIVAIVLLLTHLRPILQPASRSHSDTAKVQ
jgi:O-antigen/teichoic acid export membrane protein